MTIFFSAPFVVDKADLTQVLLLLQIGQILYICNKEHSICMQPLELSCKILYLLIGGYIDIIRRQWSFGWEARKSS